MPLYESAAVVLRSMKLGDTDRIITFFTLRYGKLKAVAKGATKPKSRFAGRVEPFVYCNMIAFGKEKADLLRLNSCDIIEPFGMVRNDFEKLKRAFVSAELVDNSQKERDTNTDGFELLLAMWRRLSRETDARKQDLLLRLFELKYMSTIGFRPFLKSCVDCGGDIIGPKAGFNAIKGGVVCHKCVTSDPAASMVFIGSVKLMGRSLEMPFEKLDRLKADPGLQGDIDKIVVGFVKYHVRRNMRSERFLAL